MYFVECSSIKKICLAVFVLAGQGIKSHIVQFHAKKCSLIYLPIIICGFLDNMSACDIISIPPTITAVDSNE